MALDADLLAAGEPALRLYAWEEPMVSLGRFQKPEEALLSGCGLPWVIRPTGGRAVLHGHDLTISRVEPLLAGESRSVGRVYRRIVAPILAALQACGVPAAFGGEGRTQGRPADCFRVISPYDVIDERTGYKLMGCAMRLGERAALIQASMPVGPPLVDPAQVFALPAEVHWVPVEPEVLGSELARACLG